MTHTRSWSLALAASLPLLACGNNGATDGVEQMRATLSDARVENDRHATACAAASSMRAMMGELEHHEGEMGELLRRMNDARVQMRGDGDRGHCMGQGFEHMSRGLDRLHDAMDEHGSRMRATEIVVDAHIECSRHTSGATTMMNGMMSDLESMPCMGR